MSFSFYECIDLTREHVAFTAVSLIKDEQLSAGNTSLVDLVCESLDHLLQYLKSAIVQILVALLFVYLVFVRKAKWDVGCDNF